MKAAVIHAPGDVRVEERAHPQLVEPTDAIIRVSAAVDVRASASSTRRC